MNKLELPISAKQQEPLLIRSVQDNSCKINIIANTSPETVESNELNANNKRLTKQNLELKNRDLFIEQNLGLVHLLAHKFNGRGIEYDDLFSAGCIGLIKAFDGFDKDRGVMFSTYAVPVILGEIKRLFRDGGTIKVSRSLKELAMKIARERSALSNKLGREPVISEIAEAMYLTIEQVTEGLNVMIPIVSLTEKGDSGDEENTKRQIDLPIVSHESEITDKISIENSLKKLSDTDKNIVYLRFYQGKTQCETAQVLSMTQVQISRREKKILEFLRKDLC